MSDPNGEALREEDLEEAEPDSMADDVEIYPEELAATATDYSIEDFVDDEALQEQTTQPGEAIEEGISYSPPSDPAVVGSEEPDSAEVATGFAPSMEESDPDVDELPAHVDNNDLELEEDVYVALRNNSETANLNDIEVRVTDGVVHLRGSVPDQDDLGYVYAIVSELEGVRDVRSRIEVAE
jgi:hypothetical protein